MVVGQRSGDDLDQLARRPRQVATPRRSRQRRSSEFRGIELRFARIVAFGRIGQKEIGARSQAPRLRESASPSPGWCRDSCRFEYDEVTRAQRAGDTRAAPSTKERSGSRCGPSGVGTQMRTASAAVSRAGSGVATNRSALRAAAILALTMWRSGLRPVLRPVRRSASVSKPTPRNPATQAQSASGNPT